MGSNDNFLSDWPTRPFASQRKIPLEYGLVISQNEPTVTMCGRGRSTYSRSSSRGLSSRVLYFEWGNVAYNSFDDSSKGACVNLVRERKLPMWQAIWERFRKAFVYKQLQNVAEWAVLNCPAFSWRERMQIFLIIASSPLVAACKALHVACGTLKKAIT